LDAVSGSAGTSLAFVPAARRCMRAQLKDGFPDPPSSDPSPRSWAVANDLGEGVLDGVARRVGVTDDAPWTRRKTASRVR